MERFAWARLAIANYREHPLAGSGFGSLAGRASRYLDDEPVFVEFGNTHSNFLQLLSECGIFGVVGLSVMTFAPLALALARLRTRRWTNRLGWFHVAFGGFFLAWGLISVSQYTVTDTRLFHVWLFYLGVWAAWFHRGGYGFLRLPLPLGRKSAFGGVEDFVNYIHPVPPEFFRDKRGLDAGCGFGRHLYYAAEFGARIVGLDFSRAIWRADEVTRGLERVRLVQGDLRRPPFRPSSFDFVWG